MAPSKSFYETATATLDRPTRKRAHVNYVEDNLSNSSTPTTASSAGPLPVRPPPPKKRKTTKKPAPKKTSTSLLSIAESDTTSLSSLSLTDCDTNPTTPENEPETEEDTIHAQARTNPTFTFKSNGTVTVKRGSSTPRKVTPAASRTTTPVRPSPLQHISESRTGSSTPLKEVAAKKGKARPKGGFKASEQLPGANELRSREGGGEVLGKEGESAGRVAARMAYILEGYEVLLKERNDIGAGGEVEEPEKGKKGGKGVKVKIKKEEREQESLPGGAFDEALELIGRAVDSLYTVASKGSDQ